jgi:hypothetical protein
MNKKETQDLIVKYLNDYLSSNGFKHKKSNRTDVEYLRKLDNGYEDFYLSTINYYDSHKLRFGFGKRIDAVEDIMAKINEQIPFTNPPYRKDSNTLGFSYNTYHGINKDGCFDFMESEENVKENVKKIIDFTENKALPFLEKLDDLRKIDKLINGTGDNSWESDWQKPFNFAGRFYLRRIIIARLSGRSDYDEFIESLLQKIERQSKEADEHFDRNDLSDELVYCIHILKNTEPLY